MEFPTALRERRVQRRLSQLDLALRAGTTQRHVSFMETGRSEPGRAMVVRLAESLELPLRERNELLLTAGYAPAYPDRPLQAPELAAVREALDAVLTGHLPYPALVVDRHGNLVAANPAFALLTEGAADELLAEPLNVYRLALHPRGLAARIANLPAWGRHVLLGLERAARQDPGGGLAELAAELAPFVPADGGSEGTLGFAVPLRLRTPRGELRLITTVTTFATATEVALAELRLEAFLPADRATAELLSTN
ncbi:helix-turn-helix transcriptional regulator [Kitasatospora azatica]|uniref:helix-turn-helix transcriptional regulator n=1 Tax=Kitasatospora azatica TaxID=58347 RepID=UPI000567EA59|nr:helix-turn-helix transcriptional regulator [Kitasatospora azatica]